MLSFFNDQSIKDRHIARVNAHISAGELIHGVYWENGRGGAVGCTVHSGDFLDYERELGLPAWLARLEERLFDKLLPPADKHFVSSFLPSIPVGVDVEPVRWRYSAILLKDCISRVLRLDIPEGLKARVVSAMQEVRAAHVQAAEKGDWDQSSARIARASASSAGKALRAARASATPNDEQSLKAAETAIWTAAWSAVPSAAWNVSAPVRITEAATEVAKTVSWAIEGSAETARAVKAGSYKCHADTLLGLLKTA